MACGDIDFISWSYGILYASLGCYLAIVHVSGNGCLSFVDAGLRNKKVYIPFNNSKQVDDCCMHDGRFDNLLAV